MKYCTNVLGRFFLGICHRHNTRIMCVYNVDDICLELSKDFSKTFLQYISSRNITRQKTHRLPAQKCGLKLYVQVPLMFYPGRGGCNSSNISETHRVCQMNNNILNSPLPCIKFITNSLHVVPGSRQPRVMKKGNELHMTSFGFLKQ